MRLPCASSVTAYDSRSPGVSDTKMPFMPSAVFSARSRTPALQPPVHVTFENTATSWNGVFSTSQPPPGCFGDPMISPLTAFQSALPSGVHPVSVEPLKTTSGLNVGPAASTGQARTQPRTTTEKVLDIDASLSAAHDRAGS